MSKIWSSIIILSIAISFFVGSTDGVIGIITKSSMSSIETLFTIAGMTCFWSGMFNIFSKTKCIKVVSKLLTPVINKIFKNSLNAKELENVSLNITSNVIGIGNAATVYAVKAVEEMQKNNLNKKEPSYNMSLFAVINTASVQLVPTSIISYRILYNSNAPNMIIIPNLIISFVSLTVGIITYNLIESWKKKC